MIQKVLHKKKLLFAGLSLLLVSGCKNEDPVFEATPSDAITITPNKTGNNPEDLTMVISSTPVAVDFAVALYKVASANVDVELAFDLSLVDAYNETSGSSFAAFPLAAASLSENRPVISRGAKATDALQIIVNANMLEEDVTYLLPLRIKSVSGGDVKLNDGDASVKYYAIRGQLPNIARGKNTSQSTTSSGGLSSRAVDGNVSGRWGDGSVTHTEGGQPEQWWEVDLGGLASRIKEVKIYNRTDCCGNRLSNYYVFVSDVPFAGTSVAESLAQPGVSGFFRPEQAGSPTAVPIGRTGRYVRVQLSQGTNPLAIAEVEVLGVL